MVSRNLVKKIVCICVVINSQGQDLVVLNYRYLFMFKFFKFYDVSNKTGLRW